jgi:phage protein D/phage baseplate assembly protein gpV
MNSLEGLSTISVELAGSPLGSADAACLGNVLVQQRLSLPSLCELRFFEPTDGLGQDISQVIGAALRVTIGGQTTPLFVGEVTAFEFIYGSDLRREIRIRGYDRLHRLRKRQPVRVHLKTDLANLARELVGDLGLRIDGVYGGVVYNRLMQTTQSDFELLTLIAQRSGLFFSVRNDLLQFLTLEGIGEPIDLRLGQNLFDAQIEVNADTACRQVNTIGWDPLRVDNHRGTAAAARGGRIAEAAATPTAVGGSGTVTITGASVQNASDAEGLAQAELDLRTAREVILTGTCDGNSNLQPGAIVKISGVAASIEGQYVLTEVTHSCDPVRGFLSEIDTTPPTPFADRAASLTAPGVVTSVADPDRMGRVRVRLPTYDDLESEWMQVLSPGAGANKGLIALPNVGDSVLVLLPEACIGQGVILGGLYGSKGPHDSGVDGTAIKRFAIRSARGQQLSFNDARESVRMETASGNFVDLAPGKLHIHATSDLEISAPGRAIVISAKTIDFRKE